MVIAKIASELIRFGIRHKSGILRAEYSVYRKAGWKPYAARGISHGTAGGSLLGTLIRDNNLDDSNASPKKSYTGKPNQARSGRFRNGNRRYNASSRFNKRRRCSCSRNRYRRSYRKYR